MMITDNVFSKIPLTHLCHYECLENSHFLNASMDKDQTQKMSKEIRFLMDICYYYP